jgi:hypothetical protein
MRRADSETLSAPITLQLKLLVPGCRHIKQPGEVVERLPEHLQVHLGHKTLKKGIMPSKHHRVRS